MKALILLILMVNIALTGLILYKITHSPIPIFTAEQIENIQLEEIYD